jgi:hypothetical protein
LTSLRFLSQHRHGLRVYAAGAVQEFDDDQAAILLAQNVVERVDLDDTRDVGPPVRTAEAPGPLAAHRATRGPHKR